MLPLLLVVAKRQIIVSLQFLTPEYELPQSVEISSEIVGVEITDFFEFETNISFKINNANMDIIIHKNIFPIDPLCGFGLGFTYPVFIEFGLGACVTSSRLSIKHCIQSLPLKLI